MNIETIRDANKITLKLDGWLDTASSPELGEAVAKISNAEEIVLDFEKVEYMSSSGLREVVACYKKAKDLQSAFSVISVNSDIMSIFELTGIDKKITILKQ